MCAEVDETFQPVGWIDALFLSRPEWGQSIPRGRGGAAGVRVPRQDCGDPAERLRSVQVTVHGGRVEDRRVELEQAGVTDGGCAPGRAGAGVNR